MTKLQPENAVAWNSRCWTRAIVGQLPAAHCPTAARRCRLRPGYVNALDSRGLVYLEARPAGLRHRRLQPGAAGRSEKSILALWPWHRHKHRKGGDAAGANADFAAARAIKASVSADYTRYGVEGAPEQPVARLAQAVDRAMDRSGRPS